jgi:hypothetical protein
MELVRIKTTKPISYIIIILIATRTIAAKILWSSIFDTSNVNQVLMSIYMTISNYSCQKYGTFSF